MHIDSSLSQILLLEQENLSQRANQSQRASNVLITPPPNEEDLARLESVELVEQAPRMAPRDVVEFNGIEIDLDNLPNEDAEADEFDIRTLTPREMVDFSLDLYIEGSVSYEEYSMMAFQVELHPQFEDTIGALTGERADPDRPRDFIQEWEDRFDFERRYPSEDPKKLDQIDRILGVLHSFENTLDYVA